MAGFYYAHSPVIKVSIYKGRPTCNRTKAFFFFIGKRPILVSRHHTTARVAAARQALAGGQSLSLACYRGPGTRRLVVARWLAEPSARLYAGELVSVESLTVLAGS